MRYSSRSPLLLLVIPAVSTAACWSSPAKYDPDLHGPLDGAVAGGGRGAGPIGVAGGVSTDGANGPTGGCVPQAPCTVPGKPCTVGTTVCAADGTSTCGETAKLHANGSVCGAGDSVCLDGVCSVCKPGAECPVESQLCKRGVIDCGSGKPTCMVSGNSPNGRECGQGMVCRDGDCAECAAGDACIPSNSCHEGILECGAGASSCRDTGRPSAAGSVCGPDKVCAATGECVVCSAGKTCDLPELCLAGRIDCSTGASTCMAAGNAPNGKACGGGRVCRDGSCEACSEGMACVPANRCHAGVLSCASGAPSCVDTSRGIPDGTMCGTNQYCSNGGCVSCTPGVSCTPKNRCRTGRTSCATGASQCEEVGSVSDGRACGDRMFCRAGACQFCNQGGTCVPANRCKVGTFSCASGSEQCSESGNIRDNTNCGENRECMGGACQDCGRDNERCCSGDVCRSANFECRNDRCVRRCGPADGQCPTGCSLSQDADCKKPDGQICNGPSECQSGACGRFFPDEDEDGQGDAGAAARQSCGRAAPRRQSTNQVDCCDVDANVKRGQERFFDKRSRCNSFDYNCDGDVELDRNKRTVSCGPSSFGANDCVLQEASLGGAECGVGPFTNGACSRVSDGLGGGFCQLQGSPEFTVRCR